MTNLSHCPHGFLLSEDICLDCLQTYDGKHFFCSLCGVCGDALWADDHYESCIGLKSVKVEDTDVLF